jgi:hypothetical protein
MTNSELTKHNAAVQARLSEAFKVVHRTLRHMKVESFSYICGMAIYRADADTYHVGMGESTEKWTIKNKQDYDLLALRVMGA